VQVLRLIHDLLKQPRLSRVPRTNLRLFFEAALHTIQRRSLVFVISDFISEPGWERPLNLLGEKHEVVAVRLLDPRERELPDVGMLVVEDAETGEQLFVDTHDAVFRRRFAEAAQKREEELRAAFRRAGVDAMTLSTEDDLVRAILQFAKRRRRRKA
jgi:uncharacterized protein (DUF58 family)